MAVEEYHCDIEVVADDSLQEERRLALHLDRLRYQAVVQVEDQGDDLLLSASLGRLGEPDLHQVLRHRLE